MYKRLGALLLLAVVFSWLPLSVAQAAANCQQQAAVLNGRSASLGLYQQRADNRYQNFRREWISRLNYASQWLPKDADKTYRDLRAYDKLHAATSREMRNQIDANKKYETAPLDCSAAHRTAMAAHKKSAGKEQIRLLRLKQQETAFYQGKLKKSNDKLLKKLHAVKAKHPKAMYPRKTYK